MDQTLIQKVEEPVVEDIYLIGTKYITEKQIGSGTFGVVFVGRNKDTGEKVAIKIESESAKHPQLEFEAKVINRLNNSKVYGVPRIKWFGKQDKYNIMVSSLLGPSLDEFFIACGKKFTLKTVLMLGVQLLYRIEHIHNAGILHRDIKPNNFLMGIGSTGGTVFAIDFGLSKKYITTNGEHIKYNDKKKLLGTARYMSVNCHIGVEQSRRDDMESLGYMFIYFLKGILPWQGLTGPPAEKYGKICKKKTNISHQTLCVGLPKEFINYFDHVKSLNFSAAPDYKLLRLIFKRLMKKEGFVDDGIFDWSNLPQFNCTNFNN